MVVYADILIVLNMIVDYFLLLCAKKFLKGKSTTLRMVLASLEGGVFSLYIFLPQSAVIIELLSRMSVCLLMSFTAFGFCNLKTFIKNSATLFLITCLYAGLMTAVWKIFRPGGMVINNSVVYFNISATLLIVFTVVFYFLFIIFSKIFASSDKFAEKCGITVVWDETETQIEAIIDTGNSIRDLFGSSEIIIIDKTQALEIFGSTDYLFLKLKNRYRAIPCSTVSGYDILDGFRADSAIVKTADTEIILKKPILAISKVKLENGYGIVSPEIFENVGACYADKF